MNDVICKTQLQQKIGVFDTPGHDRDVNQWLILTICRLLFVEIVARKLEFGS